ncbi:zinc finger matrin-type protein 5 isoform X2 [Armigeres subalbatus]|uniref:zinc finger matrin-type protein 5 isoform X2 n=1 Tax=Armigeres subalbatus TaxID=124917 RepID=UPI002ED056B7
MGKKYYCDYCKTHIQRDSDIVRKHNEDVTKVLEENARKKPCRTLLTSDECTFGASCRYSHYSPDQLMRLQQKERRLAMQRAKRLADVMSNIEAAEEITKDFLEKRTQKLAAKSSDCNAQFWTYSEEQRGRAHLPPSLQEINPTLIDPNSFAEWG